MMFSIRAPKMCVGVLFENVSFIPMVGLFI